jgi:transposase InsO family protein
MGNRKSSTRIKCSQFAGAAFTGVLRNADIAISMDDKGSWRDNVFVERLWGPSNTRRSTYAPITRYSMPAPRSAATSATSASTTLEGPFRASTGRHPIKPASTSYRTGPLPFIEARPRSKASEASKIVRNSPSL